MNPNVTIKNNISQQQASGDLRSIVTPGSVITGLLLGKDFFKNPEQYNLVKIPSLRETITEYKNFPEAKEYLEKQLRYSKKILKGLNISEQQIRYLVERKVSPELQSYWNDFAIDLLITPWRKRHEAIVTRNKFVLEFKQNPNKLSLNIESAKNFPITDLIEFKHRIAKCIFHEDKNASMYYYPKTNTVYCFGCQTSADPIKVYQTINNCSFKEAVQKLQ